MEQRSDAWFAAKLGKVGCSRLGDVCARGRGGEPSKTREDYMYELVCERLTGKRTDDFHSAAMDDGIENEALARAAYEMKTGNVVTEDGGMESNLIPGLWSSPDGLIGDAGGLEIKCPKTKKHIRTMQTQSIDRDYLLQMAGGCIVYDRTWWDFVSFDPALPDNLSLYVCRYMASALPIEEVRSNALLFVAELDELEEKLRRM